MMRSRCGGVGLVYHRATDTAVSVPNGPLGLTDKYCNTHIVNIVDIIVIFVSY